MLPLQINESLSLRLFEVGQAPLLFDTLQQNRAHLDRWLRWSAKLKTLEDVQTFIESSDKKYRDGDGFHAGMWLDGQLAGGMVCLYINRESSKSEIGYWLGEQFTGQGLVTLACREVITRLFRDEQLHRIEIQAAANNTRSCAVAERLGFQFEGIKRESEWITDSFRDHALYSLLDREWGDQVCGV